MRHKLFGLLTALCVCMVVLCVSASAMEISVEMPDGKTLALEVEPGDSIDNVKQKICDQISIPTASQYLYFRGKLLSTGRTLADYNIQKESVLWISENEVPEPSGTPLTNDNIANYMTLSSGTYCLDGGYSVRSIDITSPLTITGNVTLDLNGYVLKMTGAGSVIYVGPGATLTLTDSKPRAIHKFTPNANDLWVLDETNGTETVRGGVITGGTGYPYQLYSTVNCGGGVYIAPGGQLTMTGGNIIGCSAEYGGGVCIYPKRDGEQGQFSMSGGSIIGCSAESGGGVCAFGKFQMSGQAVIRSCTARRTSYNCGGGVWVDGSFEMSGEAIIEGCQAISESACGGGVYVNSSSGFVMSGKARIEYCQAISTPSSPSEGGGVHLANATTFTLSGSAVIQNCTATNSVNSGKAYGGGVSAACVREITLEANASIAGCIATNGSGLYITGSQLPGYGKLFANGGSVDGDVVLGDTTDTTVGPGTITGTGKTEFNGKVTVTPGSTIGSGTFNGEVINNGTITGGTFNGTVNNNGTINDGTFNGEVTNNGTINDGTFNTPITGSGTKDDPYQISTAAQLKRFRNIVNGTGGQTPNPGACAELTADIDLENEAWKPIGYASNYDETKAYSGTFDGKGYTIKNLNVSGSGNIGLFGYVSGGTIRNLTVAGSVTATGGRAGGITCTLIDGLIENCANLCTVTYTGADGSVGGIVGYAYPIDDSVAIRDCYNIGKIDGGTRTGGILGLDNYPGTEISNCYNVGSVTGNEYVGAIAGNTCYSPSNCYYLSDTSSGAARTEKEFADGTVLNLLINGRNDSEHPWYETCIYLEAAGKTLPVFKWQHQHQLTHVPAKAPTTSEAGNIEYWYCAACGRYFADSTGAKEITKADTVIPKRHFSDSSSSSYPITVPDKTENGSVAVSPKTASKGSTVTISVTPDSGYVLETISVTDKNGNDLKLTDKGNGKYTFTMPGGKVEVKVTFMEDNSVLNFFYDVPNDAYYYEAVKWAAEKGVTSGIGNNLFAPNQPCTRAQIVTFLWRAAGSPVVNYLMPFTDVDEGAYYAEAVRWAASCGIVTGLTETTFGTNGVCTRAQAAAMIYRCAQAQGKGFTGAWMFHLPFTDVPEWAYESVAWCYMNGVTTGVSETSFAPDNDCTRAQIVTFLWRAFSK